MDPIKSNNIGHRTVDLGFWKLIKKTATAENISMLELQRRIAKANHIRLQEPKHKRQERPGRFKFDF